MSTETHRDGNREIASCDRVEYALLALHSVSEGVIVHDMAGMVRFFNPSAARLHGLTVEEFGRLGPWGWTQCSTAVRSERAQVLQAEGEIRFFDERWYEGTRHVLEKRSRLVAHAGTELVVCVIHDVTERVTAQEALQHAVRHDPLTDVGNRLLLDECLEKALSAAKRHAECVGIAFVDLDDFKLVNDIWGHVAGDHALVQIARNLADAIRAEDTLARVGGDEFVVVLPRLKSAADLDSIGKKLQSAVELPLTVCDETLRVTASVGVALLDDADDAWTLIEKADIAMYQAKRDGQGRFVERSPFSSG